MQSLRFLFILLLISTLCRAQNVLVFENVKDSTDIFQLPLSKFPIQIKFKDSLAFKAVVDGSSDSVLSIRIYKSSYAIDSAINVLRAQHDNTLAQQKRKRKFRDSLNKELESQILAVKYSTPTEINISRIRTITVYNRYFKEKKKHIKIANAAAILFLGATFISASTQNPYYIGAGMALTTIGFMAKSSLSTKDLDLIIPKKAKRRKQWKIRSSE